MLSPKWFRPEHRRAAPCPCAAPRASCLGVCAHAVPYPDACAPRHLIFSPRHASPAARAVRARRADRWSVRGPARRPRRHRTTAASSPSSGRHGRACDLFKAPLPPRGRAPSRPAPLPPSHKARPSTSTSSRPTTSHPSLGLAKAQALAHCPGNVAAPPEYRPPRPSPLAATARPCQRPLRPNFGHHRVLGDHVVEHHHLPGRMHRRSRRNPASRAAKLV
jgi:hypothetical protein